VQEAQTFTGDDAASVPGLHMRAKAGERVYLCVQGAALVEPRRGPGHWEGRSQGVSVRVPGTRSMRYRVGASRGQYVQGAERPTPIDNGELVVTDHRAVFLGQQQTREWDWSKLLGIEHADNLPWTSIAVSNRQKTSGVLYDVANEEQIRFTLDLAVATAEGTRPQFVAELTQELESARAQLPPPAAIPPPVPPAS